MFRFLLSPIFAKFLVDILVLVVCVCLMNYAFGQKITVGIVGIMGLYHTAFNR
jgi:hypothetical protein